VPEPWRRTSTCSAVSSRTARLTVMRETPNWRTSACSDGTSSPSFQRPEAISLTR